MLEIGVAKQFTFGAVRGRPADERFVQVVVSYALMPTLGLPRVAGEPRWQPGAAQAVVGRTSNGKAPPCAPMMVQGDNTKGHATVNAYQYNPNIDLGRLLCAVAGASLATGLV
ncbi:hypothetical protein LCGC14_2681810, partial [marine sediment metagenome]